MGSEASATVERVRELAGPELYRRNAFRVIGMATDASRRTVGRRRQQVTVAAQAGVDVGAAGELPVPGGVRPEELRTAFDVLDHPQRRIVDEFFWLWGQTGGSCPCADKLHREHDTAVLAHARALDAELCGARGTEDSAGTVRDRHWQTAARQWAKLLRRPDLWTHLSHRVGTLADLRLNESVVTVLEAEVRRALVGSVAGLAARSEHPARLADVCGQWAWAGRHLMAESLEEQLRPLYESTHDGVEGAAKKLNGTFRAGGTKTAAVQVARGLRETVVPNVERLRAFAACGMSLPVAQLNDTTALLINNCAVALSPEPEKSAPAGESFELLDLALRLEPYDETRRIIQQNRTRLGDANTWCTTVKPLYDPFVAGLERASGLLTENHPEAAVEAVEGVVPLLRELRALKARETRGVPGFQENIAQLCDSTAVLLNNCAVAVTDGRTTGHGPRVPDYHKGLQLLDVAQEFCTTKETGRRIAANRAQLTKAREWSSSIPNPRELEALLSELGRPPRYRQRQGLQIAGWEVVVVLVFVFLLLLATGIVKL